MVALLPHCCRIATASLSRLQSLQSLQILQWPLRCALHELHCHFGWRSTGSQSKMNTHTSKFTKRAFSIHELFGHTLSLYSKSFQFWHLRKTMNVVGAGGGCHTGGVFDGVFFKSKFFDDVLGVRFENVFANALAPTTTQAF